MAKNALLALLDKESHVGHVEPFFVTNKRKNIPRLQFNLSGKNCIQWEIPENLRRPGDHEPVFDIEGPVVADLVQQKLPHNSKLVPTRHID